MARILSYIKKDTIIHRLSGTTKLICFLLWSVAGMITYDTRLLLGMLIASLLILKVSRIKIKEIAFILILILSFMVLNNIAIFLFSPLEGVEIYGTRHDLFHLVGPYTVTIEQLFYHFNITLKYFVILPIALLFVITTNPSEFASSLNRVGVNYSIAYSVALALRYIPDIQDDYHNISLAQQARGIDISRKEKFFKRIKNALAIVIPLIFSSLNRIEVVSNAMELRRFGKDKKRTWYSTKPFAVSDAIAILVVITLVAIAIFDLTMNGRFYNPFSVNVALSLLYHCNASI